MGGAGAEVGGAGWRGRSQWRGRDCPVLPVLAPTLPQAPRSQPGTAGKAHRAQGSQLLATAPPGRRPPTLKHDLSAKETTLGGQTILPRLQELRCGLSFVFF